MKIGIMKYIPRDMGDFPFDDENYLIKVKLFLVNFIERKGYEKLIV